MDLEYYSTTLEQAGVKFARGLSEAEAQQVESTYQFRFPPDLRAFLMHALPVSDGWPNWRDAPKREILRMLDWPLEGMLFDIESNSFWPEEWGTKPDSLHAAFAVAKSNVAQAPKLIPVYSHRYIPDTPEDTGNPVFSVYQTDIIQYGADLCNYLENEFHSYFKTPRFHYKEPIRQIAFWSWLVEKTS
jgi:hypothetical protein